MVATSRMRLCTCLRVNSRPWRCAA
jgi:hypothetical protein